MASSWEPSSLDVLAAHALGVKVDDRCDRCGKYCCICFENEQADALLDSAIAQVGKTEGLHAGYNYE